MLVQAVALLSLGVLCSSVALPTNRPANTERHPPQKECSRPLAELIIQEVLEDMKKLDLNAVPSLATVNATMERCMQSHLKTFIASLADLNNSSKYIARKLFILSTCKNIPKDLGRECKTAHVTSGEFLKSLDKFLRLLFEKLQMP